MAANTSVIYQIAIHATGGTALPTLPAKGAHFADLSATWKTFGNTGIAVNDYGLDEDSISDVFVSEEVLVQPPLGLGVEQVITTRNHAQPFTFGAYDIDENVLALDSNVDLTEHVLTADAETTKRTVLIEVSGVCALYFPSCLVFVTPNGMGVGDDGAAKSKIMVTPLATTAVPGGCQIAWFV